MPAVNDQEHLQHPVDLSDTKAGRGMYLDDEIDREDVRQASAGRETSKLTTMDPKNILGDNKSVITQTSKLTRGTLRALEERNPYQFIEKALMQAKGRLNQMKSTPQIVESLTDNDKKKRYLKNENKQLRDQLKSMSDNVNLLIEKMNQETLRKRKYLGAGISSGGGDNASAAGQSTAAVSKHGSVTGSTRIRAADQEIANTDKAVGNLLKEHAKLRRRLEEVQNPEFLINLKRHLKETEAEIQRQQKITKQLHTDQVRREQRLDRIIEKNEPEAVKHINDRTSRLAYLNEKLAELQQEKLRTEELKAQQANTLDELKAKMSKL